jgi:hypothetical protein
MRTIVASFALVVLVAASGCASIVNGHNQPLSLQTPDCEGASCTLTNSKGTWYVKSPGSVTVHRAYGDLMVTCAKEGYTGASNTVASSTKGMAFGNILFGGIIGAGVDIGTGAAYDYPALISNPISCKGPANAAAATAPPAAAAVSPVADKAAAISAK